jgi:hypothetical protein
MPRVRRIRRGWLSPDAPVEEFAEEADPHPVPEIGGQPSDAALRPATAHRSCGRERLLRPPPAPRTPWNPADPSPPFPPTPQHPPTCGADSGQAGRQPAFTIPPRSHNDPSVRVGSRRRRPPTCPSPAVPASRVAGWSVTNREFGCAAAVSGRGAAGAGRDGGDRTGRDAPVWPVGAPLCSLTGLGAALTATRGHDGSWPYRSWTAGLPAYEVLEM